MEGKRRTSRVHMRAWTPASGYSSPPSPVSSQLSCDEGRDKDFQSHMDENGIIGQGEIQGELEKEDEALKDEEDMFSDVGTPEPEEGPPAALEDFSCHLSELLDSEPLSHDHLSPTHNDIEYSVSLEDWSDDDEEEERKLDVEDPESFNISTPIPHSRPEKDLVSTIASEEIEEINIHRDESYPVQWKTDPQDNWMDHHDAISHEGMDHNHKSGTAILETRTPSQNSCDERSHVSSSPAFKNSPRINPLLSEVSNGEVEAEPFAALGWSNSSPRTFQPFRILQEKKAASALNVTESEYGFPELEQKPTGHFQNYCPPPIFSPRNRNSTRQEEFPPSCSAQPSAKDFAHGHRRHHAVSKTSYTDLNDVRKGQLSHPLPDFSKVPPRVRLPKTVYKPPKSRKPPHKEISKPETPVVSKSPADIVRETLLSNSEGPSDSSPPTDSQKPLTTTIPEGFQCPMQASTMVQQLQEDYNRLLTKYAEAENTIDRLRLEAKVCLHSDPPKPSQLVLSGALKEGSKVITLSFPQAQRVELGIDALQPNQQRPSSATRGTPTHPSYEDSFSSSWHESPATTPLTETLSTQMARFQLQVNEFEKLLKSRRLKPYEQTRGFSQLAQGQVLLEKAYLTARLKHQQMQREMAGKSKPFDPDRELESLIFQSGIHLEELKEWIEQSEHNQLIDLTPSKPPHALQPCRSLKDGELQPENPASAPHPEVMVGVEVSSVSVESDGDREDGEEDMLPSVLLSLSHKHQHVENDFSNLMDHYQNFRDLSKKLNRDRTDDVNHDLLELRDYSPHTSSTDRIETEQQWRNKNEQDSIKPHQLLPMADSLSSPSCSPPVCNSMETLPDASVPASALPRKQHSGRRAAGSIKSHSSLGVRSALRREVSKENDNVLSSKLQDGVVTPETDSGFLGSESSQLTPAAQSPVQQRTALRATRPSVAQEKRRINPMSSSPEYSEPNPSGAHAIASGGAPESLGRRGESRRQHIPILPTSSSPLRWPSTPLQPWPSIGISELEQQSKSAHSLSEDGTRQGDQHTQPSEQDPSYHGSSSLTAPYHHGDHLKAQSSGQLANHHEAIESLQAEVLRLRERLEGTLRTSRPFHRVSVTSSTSKDIRDYTPPHTPHPRQCDFRSVGRKAASKRESNETEDVMKKEQERTLPRRRSASVPRQVRPEPESSTESEHAQSEDMTSEHIPASRVITHTTRKARAETGRGRKAHTNRHKRSSSADRSDLRNDEAEGRRTPVALCLNCLAQSSRTSGRQARNTSAPNPTHHYTNYCPLCGVKKREKILPPANQSSMGLQTRGVYLAVAPPPPVIGSVPVLQCVSVCPSVLYYSSPVVSTSYQKPLYIPLSEGKGYRAHRRRSQSVDTQCSLNRSLGQAIATASSLREMTRRMVHSLSSGLHNTSPLTKSCTY